MNAETTHKNDEMNVETTDTLVENNTGLQAHSGASYVLPEAFLNFLSYKGWHKIYT